MNSFHQLAELLLSHIPLIFDKLHLPFLYFSTIMEMRNTLCLKNKTKTTKKVIQALLSLFS